MIRTGALLLTTLMLIASCDLCTLFGLDYDKGNEDQTTQQPAEEEAKDPGYFYTSGNTEDYLSSITAVSETGEEETVELTNNKYRLGRATITVAIASKERIKLTRSGKDPLIYTYEE